MRPRSPKLRPIVKGDEHAFSCHTRCAIIGRRFRALNRTDGERPHQAFVTPHLPDSDAGVPDPVRPDRVRAAAPDSQRLPRQSLAQRPDHRRAVDRHHPVVPPRHPAVSRSGLGQRLSQRRSEARRQAGTQDAGADGGDARRRAGRSRRHLGADHARLSRLAGDAARRGARHFALSHRAAGLPRPPRHVLGPDRDRRFGRHHHQRPEDRRRRRYGVRGAQGRARRAARRHGHFILVVAVRPGRLAGARLSRFADEPGAEPLLHQSGRLARHDGAGPRRRHDERRRGAARRHPRRLRAAAPFDRGRRRQQGDHGRHGQSRRGDPRARATYAQRAADDPRLGGRAGQAQPRPAPLHGAGGAGAGAKR